MGSFGTDFDCPHWLSLDPCGLICVTVSYGLHFFSLFASAFTLLQHSLLAQIMYGVLYVPLALLALASLLMANVTNPGAVPLGARPIPASLAAESDSIVTERDSNRGGLRRRRGIRRCRKCRDNYKPARAHHDSVTGRCVVKMDHYCPWVGNAVGIMNHKFFILFILYTFLTATVSLALILNKMIKCGYYINISPQSSATPPEPIPGCNLNSATTGVIFAQTVVTVLFFFFTCCMLLEQTEAISTNMSKIARMKTRAGLVAPSEYAPVATEFNEVFGGDHPHLSWHWFLPLPVRFPEWAAHNIMGFEYDSVQHPAVPYQEPSNCDSSAGSGLSGMSGVSSVGRQSEAGSEGQGPGGMDVETGNTQLNVDQEPLEEELLMGDRSERSVKKRTPSSSIIK